MLTSDHMPKEVPKTVGDENGVFLIIDCAFMESANQQESSSVKPEEPVIATEEKAVEPVLATSTQETGKDETNQTEQKEQHVLSVSPPSRAGTGCGCVS